MPSSDPVIPPSTSKLPVNLIKLVTSMEPLNINVSALENRTNDPVSFTNVLDPVTVSEPDITTSWNKGVTYDAVSALEAVVAFAAYEADNA